MLKEFRNLIFGLIPVGVVIFSMFLCLIFKAEVSLFFWITFGGGSVLLLTLFGRMWLRYRYLMKKYCLLVDGANALPHGVFIINGQNRIVFKNKPYEIFFHENLLRNNLTKTLLDITKRVRMGQASQEMINIKDNQGDKLIYRLTASILNAYSGYIAFSVGDVSKVIDQTGRDDMKDFLDKAPVGVFSINSAGEFLYINQVAVEWFGRVSTKKINLFRILDVADDRRSFFPPVENINLQKTYEHYFSVNKQFYRVFQRFIKVGKEEYVTCSIVFKSKRNRQSINLEGQNFKSVFDDAPAGILLVDEKRNILAANQKFSYMIQKHTSELVGRNLDGFLNFSCKKAVLEALQKALEKESTQKPIEISFKGTKNDDLAAYISPLQEDDRVIGAIIHFLSTSEQKKMEIQFVHSQRMQAVGQLAGGVAHDFNNLLTAMIGFCDLLLQRHSPAEQSFSDIMQIKQNANRAAGLVRQLLAFSRQQSLQPKVINITDALSELSALLRRLLGPAIELKVKHARDLWFIKVDKGQFEQVVINLAVNARDAMENSGVLKITTSNYLNKKTFAQNHDSMPPGEYVLIEIEDTGCGISMDIIDRIFEPFFSTKAVGSGTGLGLSTVYGIVRQTGGFIFVDSMVGKGTNFRIFLPRHIPKEQEETLIQEDKHLSDLTGTAHILLVEDEDAVRMFAARALKDKGYEVMEASNGQEAIQIAKQNNIEIDLIITDVVMPGMDGPQMINEIRQFMPSVKVVFISGYAEDSFRKKLNNEENIHFLPKPFNLKDLALKVKDILN
jgi:two-component system, cell cycle sensor histidine kinase and response regulator CckA